MRVKERAIKDQGTVEAPELSDRLRDDTMRHDRPSLRSRSGMPRLNLRWAHCKPLPIPFFLGLLFWMKKHQPLSFWGYFG